ncbi:MAG: phosphate propanoyltransferase [Bacilli bacterium]|nr:phosphate propanoyltransferase [Bacilli bacterium]
MDVSIGVSNRHVHLCKRDLEILFGEGFNLEVKKDLVQPGEFASTSVVTIKTDKDCISNVRVLGPVRGYTQVEISKTDAFKLGINPPVRDSGDLDGSEGVTLIGPKGSIDLNKGCIIATRHIHISPSKVKELGLDGIYQVSVQLDGLKGGILSNVSLKINENYAFEMHIDTDDANAHLVKSGDIGKIIR